jgi:hypothetical protein
MSSTGIKLCEVELVDLTSKEISVARWDPSNQPSPSFLAFYKDGSASYCSLNENRYFEFYFSLLAYQSEGNDKGDTLRRDIKRISVPIVSFSFHPVAEDLIFILPWQSNKVRTCHLPTYSAGFNAIDMGEQVLDVASHDVLITSMALSKMGEFKWLEILVL